jgi:multidrug resistance efflux pump
MRGVVKAATQAVLYAQIQGRVNQLPYKEGQRFEKGQTLIQIDCDKYRAELAAAYAEHDVKDKVYKNNLELTKLDAVSKLDLETSEAEAKKAFAAIRVAEVNVKGCQIAAPFGGRVVGVMVNEFENVFPNDKLISLLDDTSLEIELVLPSSALNWLKRKSTFTFVVDETRRSYPAKVKEIGAAVDPASQTVKVIGAIFLHTTLNHGRHNPRGADPPTDSHAHPSGGSHASRRTDPGSQDRSRAAIPVRQRNAPADPVQAGLSAVHVAGEYGIVPRDQRLQRGGGRP